MLEKFNQILKAIYFWRWNFCFVKKKNYLTIQKILQVLKKNFPNVFFAKLSNIFFNSANQFWNLAKFCNIIFFTAWFLKTIFFNNYHQKLKDSCLYKKFCWINNGSHCFLKINILFWFWQKKNVLRS